MKMRSIINNIRSKISKTIPKSFKERSSEILVGMGIAGWITTTILSIRATPKAMAAIENKKDELNEEKLSKKEIFKTSWKFYILPAVSGACSSVLILAGFSKEHKEKIKYAIGYSMSETLRQKYEEKILDVVGEDKVNEIKEQIINDKKDEMALTNQKTEDLPLNGFSLGDNVLCYDETIGGYFLTTKNKIDAAKNEANDKLNAVCMSLDLNEWKDILADYAIELPGFGFNHTSGGELIGWNSWYKIDITYDSMLYEGRIPCLYIRHLNPPVKDYDKL